MTDPAIAAAQRVAERHNWDAYMVDAGTAAAREALAPLRELHRPIHVGDHYAYCEGCDYRWPCDSAKLIYREEEL